MKNKALSFRNVWVKMFLYNYQNVTSEMRIVLKQEKRTFHRSSNPSQ